MLHLNDRVTVGKWRRTTDGFLVTNARVARSGIQVYAGAEVGRPEMDEVRVYRPELEVFSGPTLRSFAHRPVTNNHPDVPVTSDNWRKYAVGQTGDEVMRDGQFVRVPMVLMDAEVIRAVEDGKRELSQGYTCDLKWGPGTTDDGQPYDAVQTQIRGNHTAIVKAARGGSSLRLGDGSVVRDEDPDEPDENEDIEEQEQEEEEEEEGFTFKFSDRELGFDPSQPRAPAGTPEGGQWVESGRGDPYTQGVNQTSGSPTRAVFRSAAEAKQYLKAQQKKWNQARVEKTTFIRRRPRGGLPGLLGFKKKEKVETYGISDEKTCPHCGHVMGDDATTCPECNYEMADAVFNDGEGKMKVMVIDGITCEMSDTAFQVVNRALKAKDDELAGYKAGETAASKEEEERKKKEEEAAAAMAAKDAEIATLKKQISDAKLTPTALDKLVVDRVDTITKAKALLGDRVLVDGRSDAEIRRQVVDTKLGDIAKGWSDGEVASSFRTLTVDVANGVSDIQQGFAHRAHMGTSAVDAAYAKHDQFLNDAWKGKAN